MRRNEKDLTFNMRRWDFRDAVTVMKSPLQEDEDLAFFYSLLPSVRSLNTDQKIYVPFENYAAFAGYKKFLWNQCFY
jgi:hypothetical protein